MKIKTIIVENEINVREAFIDLIKKNCPQIEITGEAENIGDAYHLILEKKPDLVFLDIEMTGGNGFELLAKFTKIPFETVFVSSYGHYTIPALRLSALDYLLKPVLVDDLVKIPARVKEIMDLKESAFKYKALQDNLKNKEEEKKLVIQTRSKLISLNLVSIVYLEADENYTHITIVDLNKKFLVTKTLKEFEETLCEETGNFIRIHKKFIVNMSYIKQVDNKTECTILLNDGTRLEVSRRKKQLLLNKFYSQ